MAHIKTYARIKPSCHLFEGFEISPKWLSLHVPELSHDYGSSPGKVRASIGYDFQFHHVFDIDCTQDDIFDNVAKDIVEGFVNGYNGTIFAFGQTGSGKTFTMEGGSHSYRDRGIAPRVLSTIYKYLEQREDDDVTVEISYLEIYQEVAYDLLSSAALNTFSPVVPLPKISVVEGLEGLFVMRNLSLHIAANEQVAQCLLLQGQSNRKVAETPVNQRSSRSHGVVTIHLTCKAKGSDIIVRSKLHLVDLAGSERVSKTGVDGQQLSEAKSINLSLHHLETVIIALQADSIETGRQRLNIFPPKRRKLFNCYDSNCIIRMSESWRINLYL
ncbi:kinesin-like protein KIF6 [Patella vulgata]|uniref:kinesin-like protein KIF6 n=1 Tax=Patella vulgata TaxID=6465 RepID=UPI0021802D28|nr:kinesin-like protein KIF6 [Patella vulgata]